MEDWVILREGAGVISRVGSGVELFPVFVEVCGMVLLIWKVIGFLWVLAFLAAGLGGPWAVVCQILVLGGGFPIVGGTIEGYVIPFRVSLSGGGSLILTGIASLTAAMATGLGVPLSC